MQITRTNIIKGITKIRMLYKQFDEHIEKFGLNEIVNEWENTFKEINLDYEELNEDFIKAIYNITTKSKFPPTIHEIVEEIGKIYKTKLLREKSIAMVRVLKLTELFERTFIKNNDKAIANYIKLSRKYTYNQIEAMVKEKKAQHNSFIYALEECLEELVGEINE